MLFTPLAKIETIGLSWVFLLPFLVLRTPTRLFLNLPLIRYSFGEMPLWGLGLTLQAKIENLLILYL